MSAPAPALPADLETALRRLRLAAIRKLAPELVVVAKTQRWSPEDFLRTLVEAEIAARDESNARGRLKAAAFPVAKTLEQFDVSASSVPKATLDYLASLEWIAAKENVCFLGPPARARAISSSRSATPRSTQGGVCATSVPPSSSRPSTGVSPTTRSAR